MRNLEMTVETHSQALKAETDRGRYKVLALVTLYLVLAVAFGIVRNELHAAPAPAAHAVATPVAVHAGNQPRLD